MAVHRRGPKPEAAPRPRRNLGRVQVTIDDLRALVEFLDAHPDTKSKALIEFSGGAIDSAEDLVSLSDEELSEIVVKNSEIEVYLSESHAYCVGSTESTHAIYAEWARLRPADSRSHGIRTRSRRRAVRSARVIASFYSLLGISGIIGILLSTAQDPTPAGWWFFAGMTVLASLVVVTSWLPARQPPNRAEIYAMTIKEFRDKRDSKQKQQITWLIAGLSVAVAAIGVLVTLLVNQ